MNESFSAQNDKERAVETLYYCAMVIRAPLKTFENIKRYLLDFPAAEIVFQTKSTDYLWITKAPKKEGLNNG